MRAEGSIASFAPRNIANLTHGLARMQHDPGQALLQACATQAVACVMTPEPDEPDPAQQFLPQNFANLLWSFAALGAPQMLSTDHAPLMPCIGLQLPVIGLQHAHLPAGVSVQAQSMR